jgi:predicted transcriptional regulator
MARPLRSRISSSLQNQESAGIVLRISNSPGTGERIYSYRKIGIMQRKVRKKNRLSAVHCRNFNLLLAST